MAIQPTTLSPPQTHYISGLTIEQFNGLFEKKIATETFNLLARSAGDGNLNSIDLLHNIALRQDSEGRKAENILFDLFSGKLPGKKGIDKEIQKTSKVIYQSTHHKEAFIKPSKLLYIIGSAIENQAAKLDIINLIKACFPKELPSGSPEELNPWSPSRMTMSEEINSAIDDINDLSEDITINHALGLYATQDLQQRNNNQLIDIIAEKIINKNFNQYELIPVNTHEHWILLMAYKDPSSKKMKALVFNSFHPLNSDVREELIEVTKFMGVNNPDVIFIEGNLQTHVPNGCGLFVIEAIKQIVENHQTDPVATLQTFHRDFVKQTKEEQEQFNRQRRQQLFSTYYDNKYLSSLNFSPI
ncbi:SPI-2 type III secretion system effector deubiquitinase SseL [Providencia sp.]